MDSMGGEEEVGKDTMMLLRINHAICSFVEIVIDCMIGGKNDVL
jgi:hypothetical protein